jgi:hypothetical protein
VEKSSFEALVEVIRVLQYHEIPYMLVGAFSSNAYGYPRATKVADIVIEYHAGVLDTIRASFWIGHTSRLGPINTAPRNCSIA